jgi:hypothetical protein
MTGRKLYLLILPEPLFCTTSLVTKALAPVTKLEGLYGMPSHFNPATFFAGYRIDQSNILPITHC